jgi:hypothetical protein
MRERSLYPAAALTLFGILTLSACSSDRTVPAGGNPPGGPAAERAQAGEPVTGQPVTKDVPHSTESVSDIKKREAKDPLPPRGDVAIPPHRIPRGDNAAAPPAGKPAGTEKPGEPSPPGTGGY